jgi:hypothetical protein
MHRHSLTIFRRQLDLAGDTCVMCTPRDHAALGRLGLIAPGPTRPRRSGAAPPRRSGAAQRSEIHTAPPSAPPIREASLGLGLLGAGAL